MRLLSHLYTLLLYTHTNSTLTMSLTVSVLCSRIRSARAPRVPLLLQQPSQRSGRSDSSSDFCYRAPPQPPPLQHPSILFACGCCSSRISDMPPVAPRETLSRGDLLKTIRGGIVGSGSRATSFSSCSCSSFDVPILLPVGERSRSGSGSISGSGSSSGATLAPLASWILHVKLRLGLCSSGLVAQLERSTIRSVETQLKCTGTAAEFPIENHSEQGHFTHIPLKTIGKVPNWNCCWTSVYAMRALAL